MNFSQTKSPDNKPTKNLPESSFRKKASKNLKNNIISNEKVISIIIQCLILVTSLRVSRPGAHIAMRKL